MSTVRESYTHIHIGCYVRHIAISKEILSIPSDRYRVKCPLCITSCIVCDLDFCGTLTHISDNGIGPYLFTDTEPSLDPILRNISSGDTLFHAWIGNEIPRCREGVVEIHIH